MKNSIIYGLSALFLVVVLNSCGKTTNRKITNDWKIVFQEEEQKNLSYQIPYRKIILTESALTDYKEFVITGPDSVYVYSGTSTGVVKANVMTIKKDGTWKWYQELFYENEDPFLPDATTKKELSGTWSFLKKTKGDDFKKNERVVFNVLVDNYSTLYTPNQTETNFSEYATYLTGENVMVFTIKESSQKELELELKSASTYVYSGSFGVDSQSKTLKMTLKEK